MNKTVMVITVITFALCALGLTKNEKIILLKEYYQFEPNSIEFMIAQLQSEILDLDTELEGILKVYDYNSDGTVNLQDFAYFQDAYSRCSQINRGVSERVNRLKQIQVGDGNAQTTN